MAFSVCETDGIQYAQRSDSFLYQSFPKEEWDAYPFASKEDLQWFRDAKYGLFFHVGLSAHGRVDIGWSRHTHKLPDPRSGPIPDDVYDGWADVLKLEDFDADAWMQLAKDGGMQYVVIITKHHDGFHMWDTDTSDHKITNSPFGRDYIAELVAAARRANLRIGLYFSQRDWFQPDYEPVDATRAHALPKAPFFEMNEGETFSITEKHKRFIDYMHRAVKELMSRYGKIDLLWWDACWYNGMFRESMWDSLAIEREARALQPHLLINNRASVPGDFDTPECRVGSFQNHRPWETCMCLGEAWAWTGSEIKSFHTVVQQLVQCVCGDGNYLLSIGAMPNGAFDTPEITRIREVGAWTKKYGESIYGTRGGPFLPCRWGGSTYRDNIVYLHILNAGTEIYLPAQIAPGNGLLHWEVLTGQDVSLAVVGEQMTVCADSAGAPDVIVKLTYKQPVEMPELRLDAEKNRFDQDVLTYGDILTQCPRLEAALTWSTAVPPHTRVTGISLEPETQDPVCITILQSAAGGPAQVLHTETLQSSKPFCYTVTRFEAGAPLVGAEMEQLQLQFDRPFSARNIKVYAQTNF